MHCYGIQCSYSWWRHQMETFSALLALCKGNSPAIGEFPPQRPVTRCFGVFFDLGLNKRLSKSSTRRWFETSSRLSWRHCNVVASITNIDLLWSQHGYIIYQLWDAIALSIPNFNDCTVEVLEWIINKVWWLRLVPTSTTRFASDVGYRMAKI